MIGVINYRPIAAKNTPFCGERVILSPDTTKPKSKQVSWLGSQMASALATDPQVVRSCPFRVHTLLEQYHSPASE